jgi:hypothetical protein
MALLAKRKNKAEKKDRESFTVVPFIYILEKMMVGQIPGGLPGKIALGRRNRGYKVSGWS